MKSYKNINDPQRSFVSAFVEKHSEKNQFFEEVEKLIDWKFLTSELKKFYTKGLTDRGAKAYSPLLLFKMALISEWYDMSDHQTEIMVNDSISAIKFCGLTLEDPVPGHSTLSRFKKDLAELDKYDHFLKWIEEQLSSQGVEIKKGFPRTDAKLVKPS